jgi:hypothetical protein
MLLAILLLSFGVSQAADSVAVWIYDVAGDALLDPATDTIYTADIDGNPLSYQIWIGLENDVNLGGMSLGFHLWSDDGLIWQYDAQPGGWGPLGQGTGLQAVTVITGSRLDPPSAAFDMTQLLVTEKDVDGLLDDTLVFGGVSMQQTLEVGAMDPCLAIHFTPGPVGFMEEKTFCIDSAFVPPAANWVYTNVSGFTFPPAIAPALCMPVATLDPNGVEGNRPLIPYTFDLGQNYPNPFNPSTAINYSVEHKCKVDISIFNILGQKVSALVDDEMDAGVYQAIWDGKDDNGAQVASGIYFYKMITSDYVETRKMVLMR